MEMYSVLTRIAHYLIFYLRPRRSSSWAGLSQRTHFFLQLKNCRLLSWFVENSGKLKILKYWKFRKIYDFGKFKIPGNRKFQKIVNSGKQKILEILKWEIQNSGKFKILGNWKFQEIENSGKFKIPGSLKFREI